VPITEYCDKNQLSTKQRLELFIPVCHAIQHAHQKGIIHRDIKPSNVMITLHDGIPVPTVIDFGVAKATNQRLTEKPLFTNYAQMIGTPAYMSPEQAEMSGLDIDTRTDVYSLGVLLYELLTGATPFDSKELLSKGYAEMQRIITQQEPLKPSTRMSTLQHEQRTVISKNHGVDVSDLSRGLRGDLDWIVMKCLEKDRTRRYEAASALAADIQRHLNTEPVQACPPSRWYEFQKTVRRHKVGFGATAAVILVLMLGVAVSSWQAKRALRAERQAVQDRDRAITAETSAANERDRAMAAEGEAQEQRSLALQNLYGAHVRLASQDWETGQLQSMIETLKEDIPQTGQPDLRIFAGGNGITCGRSATTPNGNWAVTTGRFRRYHCTQTDSGWLCQAAAKSRFWTSARAVSWPNSLIIPKVSVRLPGVLTEHGWPPVAWMAK